VHLYRVTCPWLITRFIDSEAELLFVPCRQILKMVDESGAIPFDAPGVELGHQGGACSFQTIVSYYEPKDPALLLLAVIVGCADTDRLADQPVAAGLEDIAVGYSMRFPNGKENLAMQFEVYDSLHAWCGSRCPRLCSRSE
jgi:hypothetical protein